MELLVMLASIALLVICLWAGGAWPPTRPWAIAIFLWAANSTAFYLWYLVIRGGVVDDTVLFWSALIRLQAIVLAGGALLIAVVKGRRQ
jgi:hypothetical protein